MKLSVIKDRSELMDYVRQLSEMLDKGKPIQAIASFYEGVQRTPAQNAFYYKLLSTISSDTGSTVNEISEEMSREYFGEVVDVVALKLLSIEEFSAYLHFVIDRMESELGYDTTQLRPHFPSGRLTS